MKAIVLCGGAATRLSGVLGDRPKAMAQVVGRPFLEWLLLGIRAQGIRDAVLATGHLGHVIRNGIGSGHRLRMSVTYSHEERPLGTAGAVRLAMSGIADETVLVLNGDSFCRFELTRFIESHAMRRARASLWLLAATDSARYGSVELAPDGAVHTFLEKATGPQGGLISAGVYLLQRDILDLIPDDRPSSIELDILPSLVGRGLFGVLGAGAFLDIGTPESYRMADRVLSAELKRLDSERQSDERRDSVNRRLSASAAVQRLTAERAGTSIVAAADILASAFRSGFKVLLCGNGGSAADCQHMAAEFVSLLTRDFQRPGLPAIALTTDTSFLTAHSNDLGFEGVFERQVRALGKPGDVLIGISTSGNSPNVCRAVDAARELGLLSVGLLGEGGRLIEMVDCAVVVPSRNTQHIQESLLPVEHTICHLVERELFRPEGEAP